MVLDDGASKQLERIIKEQRLLARIKEHGLSPRRKLLLVGPPGTGKTMTAPPWRASWVSRCSWCVSIR
jgi:SpoVK/Ycf46/Vps4 family AAA+-type ATPase